MKIKELWWYGHRCPHDDLVKSEDKAWSEIDKEKAVVPLLYFIVDSIHSLNNVENLRSMAKILRVTAYA